MFGVSAEKQAQRPHSPSGTSGTNGREAVSVRMTTCSQLIVLLFPLTVILPFAVIIYFTPPP